jgi:hypothetical protein
MPNQIPAPGTKIQRTFFRTLVWTLPVHVLMATSIAGGSAALYSTSISGYGAWATVGGWSLTALYVIVALLGGALAGLLDAARQTMERAELALREWLHTVPAIGTAEEATGRDISTVRHEYEAIVDQCVTQIADRLRLPRWLEKLLRTALQREVVDRFIASCTGRGIQFVAPQEFRNWLLAEGVSLGFLPVHDQLSGWRYLILGSLGLLAVIALALSLFTT